MHPIYTIGHSNHDIDTFQALLREHDISVLCDVRSSPGSKYNPQYNQTALSHTLAQTGVRYMYFGESLGGRQPDCVNENGMLDYARVARKPSFLQACADIEKLAVSGTKLALMCAEKNPAHCHRTLLISRYWPFNNDIRHILSDATILPHHELGHNFEQPALF